MEGFGGRYPGGPSRGPEGKEEPRRDEPRLTETEDIERRAANASVRRRRAKRKRRILIGFFVVLLTAGGVGIWVGVLSHRTSEEIVREREGERRTTGDEERDRMLRELLRQPPSDGRPTAPPPGSGGGS